MKRSVYTPPSLHRLARLNQWARVALAMAALELVALIGVLDWVEHFLGDFLPRMRRHVAKTLYLQAYHRARKPARPYAPWQMTSSPPAGAWRIAIGAVARRALKRRGHAAQIARLLVVLHDPEALIAHFVKIIERGFLRRRATRVLRPDTSWLYRAPCIAPRAANTS